MAIGGRPMLEICFLLLLPKELQWFGDSLSGRGSNTQPSIWEADTFHWTSAATDWNSSYTCVYYKHMKTLLSTVWIILWMTNLTKHIHFKDHKQENQNPVYTTYSEPDQEDKSNAISVNVDKTKQKRKWNYFWKDFAPNIYLCLVRRPQPKWKHEKLLT